MRAKSLTPPFPMSLTFGSPRCSFPTSGAAVLSRLHGQYMYDLSLQHRDFTLLEVLAISYSGWIHPWEIPVWHPRTWWPCWQDHLRSCHLILMLIISNVHNCLIQQA